MPRSKQQSPGPISSRTADSLRGFTHHSWWGLHSDLSVPFDSSLSVLFQIELGAPGFPPHVLSSFIKQQPLVIARLASFLGS